MSLLTKFLHQKARIQLMKRNPSGEPLLDQYGEPLYENRLREVKCRREQSTQDVLTAVGATKKSNTRYFLDNSQDVSIGDKIDGKPILAVQDFINSSGLNEGFEVLV